MRPVHMPSRRGKGKHVFVEVSYEEFNGSYVVLSVLWWALLFYIK